MIKIYYIHYQWMATCEGSTHELTILYAKNPEDAKKKFNEKYHPLVKYIKGQWLPAQIILLNIKNKDIIINDLCQVLTANNANEIYHHAMKTGLVEFHYVTYINYS